MGPGLDQPHGEAREQAAQRAHRCGEPREPFLDVLGGVGARRAGLPDQVRCRRVRSRGPSTVAARLRACVRASRVQAAPCPAVSRVVSRRSVRAPAYEPAGVGGTGIAMTRSIGEQKTKIKWKFSAHALHDLGTPPEPTARSHPSPRRAGRHRTSPAWPVRSRARARAPGGCAGAAGRSRGACGRWRSRRGARPRGA